MPVVEVNVASSVSPNLALSGHRERVSLLIAHFPVGAFVLCTELRGYIKMCIIYLYI